MVDSAAYWTVRSLTTLGWRLIVKFLIKILLKGKGTAQRLGKGVGKGLGGVWEGLKVLSLVV